MSQLQRYESTSPRVRHVPGHKPTVTWQRRQGPYPRWLRACAVLFSLAIICVMVAPIL